MAFKLLGFLDKKVEVKGNGAVTAMEETRDGQPKAYINDFFYKPPFGYPRYKDLNYYRIMASSVYVDMAETAIIDEICAVPWDIVSEDEAGNDLLGQENRVIEIRKFFDNPNTNKESFEDLLRFMLPDLLELNSGVWVKVFNRFGKMVEIVSRDGASFTKNPDPFGMYTNRADLIFMKNVQDNSETQLTQNSMLQYLGSSMDAEVAKQEAAYFQYGWNTAHRPIPFGKREIIWFEKKRRTDDLYGRSAMEVLSKTVQTLVYAVEHNLGYFNDNSIPPGVLGFDGIDANDMKAFAKQWIESQKVKDENGFWKKAFHKLPMVNKIPKFERLGYTNQELQIIEQQKWWAKLVWAAFGITSTELGFTEDAKGSANQIVQSSISKKRIIYPLLRLIEYHINSEIIPEFGYPGIKFKFKIFDVDEETKKWNLYKLQVEEAKLKTPNEVRNSEGLDPIEGGDEIRNSQSGNNFYMNGTEQEYNRQNRNFQNERDQMRGKPKEKPEEKARTVGGFESPEPGDLPEKGKKILAETYASCRKDGGSKEKCARIAWGAVHNAGFKSVETKPGMGHSDKWWEVYHALRRQGHDKESAARIANTQVKALDTETPLVLNPNEEMDYQDMKRVIIDLLDKNKEKIFEALEQNKPDDQLIKIKALTDVPDFIKKVFEIFGAKTLSDEIIKSQFMAGWDKSEKQIDQNVQFNQKALEFLQDHTFDNIKGMTEEISNDLKQELERGIINGEGITKLKARVNEVFKKGNNRAEMIARTETNRADNQGKLLAMKGSGVQMKKKVIIAHDDRTSALCKRLDRQTVNLDEKFTDSTTGQEWESPPFHVNCRSTMVFLTE